MLMQKKKKKKKKKKRGEAKKMVFWSPSWMEMSIVEFLKAREKEVLWVLELWLFFVMSKDVADANGRIQTPKACLVALSFNSLDLDPCKYNISLGK